MDFIKCLVNLMNKTILHGKEHSKKIQINGIYMNQWTSIIEKKLKPVRDAYHIDEDHQVLLISSLYDVSEYVFL